MSESASLYRRFRPQNFDEVVGQEHVVRTLRSAVESGKVHHAYLFVGSRGTGKTSMAKILARSLNCVNGPTVTPCGECESCLTIAAGTSLDVIEMDAASNRSVDDIRELRDRVGYAPAAGHWKIYILDEAHMLTKEAWNAFLKTLEEPPPNTSFILATTEPQKVMATIVDRCQRFDFQRPSLEQISEVINRAAGAEKIEVEDGAVALISRSASGSFRDALGTLDQLISYGGDKVGADDVLAMLGAADADLIFRAVDAVGAGDARGALAAVDELVASGRDPAQFARDLVSHLRQLIVVRTTGEIPDAFSVTVSEPDRLREQAERVPEASADGGDRHPLDRARQHPRRRRRPAVARGRPAQGRPPVAGYLARGAAAAHRALGGLAGPEATPPTPSRRWRGTSGSHRLPRESEGFCGAGGADPGGPRDHRAGRPRESPRACGPRSSRTSASPAPTCFRACSREPSRSRSTRRSRC